MIVKIMTGEMQAMLPDLNPTKKRDRAIAAMITSLTGLIIPAVENVNSCLCRKRNEALDKALRAPNNQQNLFNNMVPNLKMTS